MTTLMEEIDNKKSKYYHPKTLHEAIRLELARRCLSGFVLFTNPSYKMGWVHEEICRELDIFLDDTLAGKSPRLMITMPPRHGKSELATRRFPAYVFGRYPNINFISTSYSSDLSTRMSRDVQRIIDSELYGRVFPHISLAGKNARVESNGNYSRNSDFFEILNHKGAYRASGVGGGITGMGGNILIIDDPVKDRKDADSLTVRDNIWDWYLSTLKTRADDGGGILLIQTRWHMDDLAGRLLEAQNDGSGDTWKVINFEAISSNDEKHRKAGEALDPERYPLEQLLAFKSSLGTRDWEALYQQKPVPDGGAIFKNEWLKFWTPDKLPPRFDQLLMSWDLAFKDTDGSDFVVGQVWGKRGSECFLLDQVRGRMDFIATVEAIKAFAAKWPRAIVKLIEDAANGPAVITSLKRQLQGILPVRPDGSKTARAYAITPLFEAGNVYIPIPGYATWVPPLIDEILQFPSGAHDDQVDALTQALNRFNSRPSLNIREYR